jgi:hypothetical protein
MNININKQIFNKFKISDNDNDDEKDKAVDIKQSMRSMLCNFDHSDLHIIN